MYERAELTSGGDGGLFSGLLAASRSSCGSNVLQILYFWKDHFWRWECPLISYSLWKVSVGMMAICLPIHTGLWFLRPCYISHVQPNLSLGSGSNSFERLTSVVLNAILNLGVKQSLENNHHKSLLRVATFREKE